MNRKKIFKSWTEYS